MRCLGLLAAFAAIVWCQAAPAQDQIRWQPNLEAAQRLAAQSNRLVLIHFWAPWCAPCMQVEHQVFAQSQLGTALDANFVCVKINVDEAPATVKKFGVSKIPTDVVLTPQGQLVAQTASPNTAGQYITQVNRIADGHKHLSETAVAQQKPATANGLGNVALANGGPTKEAAATGGVYSDQQYAQYLNKNGGAGTSPSGQLSPEQCNLDYQQALQGQVAVAGTSAPTGHQSAPSQQSLMNQFPKYTQAPPAASTMGSQPTHPPVQPSSPQVARNIPTIQLPHGCPPLGMDGFCPVTLLQKKAWSQGDRRWGAIHRGRTYLFAGPEQQQQFLADPDRYSPTLSGDDPVVALEGRLAVAGRREHGVTYQQRIYLFSSEESLKRFWENPNRYASEVQQAMRSSTIR